MKLCRNGQSIPPEKKEKKKKKKKKTFVVFAVTGDTIFQSIASNKAETQK
jgi:hypothetical protein